MGFGILKNGKFLRMSWRKVRSPSSRWRNYARQTLMWLGRKNGTFIQDASWVICQLRGNVPYLKWRRLTEHLYQNLKGYVENDAKEMWFSRGYTYCTRLTWCYPYTAQVRPWADREAKQCVVPFMLLNSRYFYSCVVSQQCLLYSSSTANIVTCIPHTDKQIARKVANQNNGERTGVRACSFTPK